MKFTGSWKAALLAPWLLAGCGGGDDNVSAAIGTGAFTPLNVTPAGADSTAPVFGATLTGAQATPPTGSTAVGTGVVAIDPSTRLMRASITTTGMVGTSAAIEIGVPGVSGPVVLPLAQTAAGTGIWATEALLTQTNVDALVSGSLYFVVRSAAFPTGEIRGQIQRQASGSGATTGTATGATTGAPVTTTGTSFGATAIPSTIPGTTTPVPTLTTTIPTLTTTVPTLTTTATTGSGATATTVTPTTTNTGSASLLR